MGHDVFRLGLEEPPGPNNSFRPPLGYSARERQLHDIYVSMGGTYGGKTITSILPNDFINHFSISIIMNDPVFISELWPRLCSKPIVWRTIGQGVEIFDKHLFPLRQKGMKIVRYSPKELTLEGSIGSDAVIRFGKDASLYADWVGDLKKVLTFSNSFTQRYPQEAQDYQSIVNNIPSVLGGSYNESIPQAIGCVSPDEQIHLYKHCRAYLYASGLHIPYTLNFIEAWLTGIPMVVYAPLDRQGRFYEVDNLITDGVDGFVCRDIDSARQKLTLLLQDDDTAARISAAGRRRAEDLFSNKTIRDQWERFFALVD